MTADHSGTGAVGVLTALRRLREHWVLIVALASALFWARDMAAIYGRLPAEMARHAQAVSDLADRIAGLEARLDPLAGRDFLPGEGIGMIQGPVEGRYGITTMLHWPLVGPPDRSCAARAVSAVLIDSGGVRHALDVQPDPQRDPLGDRSLALGVRPHARMGPGRAGIRVWMLWSCRGRMRVDRSAWLPFVLRGD